MAYFTFQWAEKTWEDHRAGYREGDPISYVASNQFERAGIQAGDYIYVLGISDRRPLLIARLQAAARGEYKTGWSRTDPLFSSGEARSILGDDLWEAAFYIVARAGTGTPMRFSREIPVELSRELQFKSKSGQRSHLQVDADGRIPRQSLRAVRRLAPGSPARLDELVRDDA